MSLTVVEMHHRSLPVGSTETIEARLLAVNEYIDVLAPQVLAMELQLRTRPIAEAGPDLDTYHAAVKQLRIARRAQRVLEGEMERRTRAVTR